MELIIDLHENNPNEKIIIFTQFVDTLLFLKREIRTYLGDIFIETFYGGKDKKEKADIVERFRNSDKFSILLSTEIGGEGRNFQFCRILINYDLPWNPMKLEQRIGRLDRIGQESKKIFIYNLFLEGTIETDIIFALNKRINLFEQSIGNLEPILGQIEKEFKNLIFIEGNQKQQKLREFSRNLDSEIKKAKEIEIHLDDLLIDKKSFQFEGLVSNLNCEDIKLTSNKLSIFMKEFLQIENQKYGTLTKLEKSNDEKSIENEKYDDEFLIELSRNFLRINKSNVKEKYHGTFDLTIAREKEEIDFFALGHPVINNILNFSRSSRFKGEITKLSVKKEELLKLLNPLIEFKLDQLYLLIFSIEFQGFINEKKISAILIDKKGNEYEEIVNELLDITNLNSLFEFDRSQEIIISIQEEKIQEIKNIAKRILIQKDIRWKKDVKKLNSHIFKKERIKKDKIYNYKRKVLNQKLQSLKNNVEKKSSKLPTEKQKENIRKIEDNKRKEEKLRRIKNLKEDIKFLKSDISRTEKKIDDLAFEYEDLKNSMKKRNKNNFYTNLVGFAKVEFID
ncbi:MAG: helicase-related protein [Candidatus Lokiarchaeota archaeon]